MNYSQWLSSLLFWYTCIPATILCFAPTQNRLRFGTAKTILNITFLMFFIIILFSYLELKFEIGRFALLPLLFILTFPSYHLNLKIPLCKSLSVYSLVGAFMSFLTNFACGFDAVIHPDSNLMNFSVDAALFQAVITSVFALLAFFPLRRYGSVLVDNFDVRRAWYVTLPVSWILLTYNIMIAPRKYESVHINKVFLFYWVSLALLTILLILLCIIFYFIISGMMEASEARERNRILEMQESAYLTQQRYMEETAKARHDFKHTIGTLDRLVSEGNLPALREFLDEYMALQPQNENIHLCDNTAVNALINYYIHMAKTDGTPIDGEVDLPQELPISDPDLCNILGNILENAVLACRTVKKENRFIDLVVRCENASMLYIVATNSFNGHVAMKDGNYISTKESGTGLGLKSIRETAEKYGGSARFTHERDEFHIDVALPLISA